MAVAHVRASIAPLLVHSTTRTAALALALATGCGGGGGGGSGSPIAPSGGPGGPLAVSTVSPTQGPAGGGTRVVVSGSGFATGGAVDRVLFGATPGANLAVWSDAQLAVDSPAGSGAVAVTVQRTWTTDSASEPGAFLYIAGTAPPPLVFNVVPGQGPDTGGIAVTVNGSAFQSGATVTFGGSLAPGVTVHGASRLTATLPAGTAGAVTVTVTNSDGQSGSIAGGFTYATTPTVTGIAPSTSWGSGGTIVTVSGANFVPGANVDLGGAPLANVVFVNATTLTGTTTTHAAGTVPVTVTNVGTLAATLPAAFTYLANADARTAAFTWDTAAGIDCRRRWYVNLNDASFLKDLQNQGLQTWGVAGDTTAAPAALPLTDALVRDWVRAYTLATLNVLFGRNGDGSGSSGASLNITFAGLPPTAGSRGCATPATDWSEICVGGCDAADGNPHPNQAQVCSMGLLGRSPYDQAGNGNGCNTAAEHACNSAYHGCSGCTWPASGAPAYGVFAGVIGTQWISTMSGGPLTAADQRYLDGTVTTGLRHADVHTFMQQFAHRLAYVAAHEIGHATGLVAAATSGTCTSHGGLCGATSQHNSCCSTNVMNGTGSVWGTFTPTSRAFSGQPGSVSGASACTGSGPSSWSLLQAFIGTTP